MSFLEFYKSLKLIRVIMLILTIWQVYILVNKFSWGLLTFVWICCGIFIMTEIRLLIKK